MSRIAKIPVELPQGVEFQQDGNVVTIKGSKATLSMELNSEIELTQDGDSVSVAPRSGSKFANAITGTTRALLANMVVGVTEGYERRLELFGVACAWAATGGAR